MINTRFEAYKIKREIVRSGKAFIIFRHDKNEFGEDLEEPFQIGEITGIYHEQNSNIQIVSGETTRNRIEKIPMILCLFDEIKPLGIKPDDYIFINDKRYDITGIVNIQEWSIIADISLEVVDNGN